MTYNGPKVKVSAFLKLLEPERLCKCCGSVTKFPLSDECYNPWCEFSREGRERMLRTVKKVAKKACKLAKMEIKMI